MTRTKKLFTPAEATKTLPLVKKIVADILTKGREWRSLMQKEEMYRTAEIEDRGEQLSTELADHLRELQQIGCSFRDQRFEIGLVDFPAKIDGQDVLLCWKSDEEKLEWYHGLRSGFASRRRIPPELLTES